MPDTITALVELLKESADINSRAGRRVFDSELPDDQVNKMPRGALIVRASGSGRLGEGGYQQFSDPRVDILAYGVTPQAARALYTTLYLLLHNLERTVVGDTLIHWARKAGGPNQMREPGVGWPGGVPDNSVHWPFVASSWQVLTADVPIPA